MNTKNVVIGALVAGVSLFISGFLVYGIALEGFMEQNCNQPNARPMEEMVWWALMVSNLISGVLIATIFDWVGNVTVSSGAKMAGLLGVLIALAFDLMMHAMSTMYSSFTVIIVDSLAYGFMFAIAGMLVALTTSKLGNSKA